MRSLFFVIALSALSGMSFAQGPLNVQVGFHGNIGFPVGEFRENFNNSLGGTGWGAGMTMLFNPKMGRAYSPVIVGFEGNYMNLGTDKTRETKYLPQLKTTFNYFNIGPLVRVFLSNRKVGFTPFIDGFIGMKILNTNTKIDNTIFDTINNEESLESLLSTNYESLGYGVGLGFYNRKIRNENESEHSFFLRLMYQNGDRIPYVKRGSIQVDSDEGYITYQTGRTETAMVSLQLGIIF
ncbi:MAG TPA: outer membrane beta-barrel protein [Algoriphagus sp.]|nr:outer membrane beta-barrel protein [Algoriphagus sp.]